jgi:hypothetical protein
VLNVGGDPIEWKSQEQEAKIPQDYPEYGDYSNRGNNDVFAGSKPKRYNTTNSLNSISASDVGNVLLATAEVGLFILRVALGPPHHR